MDYLYKTQSQFKSKHFLILLLLLLTLPACGNFQWNKNDNNRIYIPGRIFHFEARYIDSTGSHIKTEKLDLQVTNGFYPSRVQTQIIWTLYEIENGNTNIFKNTTGVIDNEDGFFIHQP